MLALALFIPVALLGAASIAALDKARREDPMMGTLTAARWEAPRKPRDSR